MLFSWTVSLAWMDIGIIGTPAPSGIALHYAPSRSEWMYRLSMIDGLTFPILCREDDTMAPKQEINGKLGFWAMTGASPEAASGAKKNNQAGSADMSLDAGLFEIRDQTRHSPDFKISGWRKNKPK